MEPLYIEASNLSPIVILDKSKEIFLIKGRSLPENAFSFYDPIIEWLITYLRDPNPGTIFTFELIYFNSASSKAILQIVQILEKLIENGLQASVIWFYQEEDEDSLETGETYASLVDVPFVFKKFIATND